MLYMTHRSHQMQKHKFGVMCPGVLFAKSIPVPLEHEKYCIDISRPGRNRKHYLTYRSHQMQKHKFSVTCLSAIFLQIAPGPPKH
jgi:hypothetical protein